MASDRRMGPPGSAIWVSMLDAAEAILREEGYGALTSRRVAEHVEVKQRLVYYYFKTMDDLVVETFRRLAGREMERLRHAVESNHPLREIWDVCIDTTDTRLISEFMALANRNAALSAEVKSHIEASRMLQVAAVSKGLPADGGGMPLPGAAVMLATGAALSLHRERALGISAGHDDLLKAIEIFIALHDSAD